MRAVELELAEVAHGRDARDVASVTPFTKKQAS
jgi:hypothetical protein